MNFQEQDTVPSIPLFGPQNTFFLGVSHENAVPQDTLWGTAHLMESYYRRTISPTGSNHGTMKHLSLVPVSVLSNAPALCHFIT